MLSGRCNIENHESKDVKSVGTLMMELMEPETSLLDPGSITLQHPEKWKDSLGIKSFLAATNESRLVDLEKVRIGVY